MAIEASVGDAFLITANGVSTKYYNHSPGQVRRLIRKFKPSDWKLVGDTGAVQIDSDDGHGWVYFSRQPVNNCESNRCGCQDRK
jgi:hypothetical protein